MLGDRVLYFTYTSRTASLDDGVRRGWEGKGRDRTRDPVSGELDDLTESLLVGRSPLRCESPFKYTCLTSDHPKFFTGFNSQRLNEVNREEPEF